uniref:DNA2/NAM7 helicase helicase domain-containing protein n=1 Tax=Tetraselmis chuii TaxID=63592 RepID=A0A7S1X684_9CHLO
MQETMKKSYNDSQMNAIRSGLDGSAINLVQGPPGTGKTKTILGILSIIMHSVPPDAMDVFSQMSQSTATVDPKDAQRLWLRLSSYVFGPPNPRDAHPSIADFAFDGAADGSYGLAATALPYKIEQNVQRKNHVLVCAPSNSALDEIVLRVMNTGLMDKDGRMYTPSIVRVGVNIHHSVSSVGLDTLVSHRLVSQHPNATIL